MASSPITSWEMGKQWKQCQTLFSGAPKSLQMVNAAMELKDAYFLEDSISRDKKAFLSDQCKEIEENNRMGKTRDRFRKVRDIREHFTQRRAQ